MEKDRNVPQNSPAQGKATDDKRVADAAPINDSRAVLENDLLNQGTPGREMTPEFGDAADPTSEQLGQHHRNE